MSEIFTTLQTIVIDHVRLSLMNQLRNGDKTTPQSLIFFALVVGLCAWAYEYLMGENKKSFHELIYEWRGLFQRKHSITIEGKHATGTDHYSRRPITLGNTFSKNFRAILFHVVKNLELMPDIRELKEFATNMIKGAHYEDQSSEEVKTIFTVSQKPAFLIDKEREIFCIIKESNEHRESESLKVETRVIKFNISVFSYKSNVSILTEFISNIQKTYQKHLEEKRKGRLFVYALNNVEVRNDDDDDTVGGWKETPHETMKSFDNLFFEGKPELLKKIDFFINNKEWYKEKGVPYTLGIGLYGPPGTGKTSFIKALASMLGRHIVSINLSSVKTKRQYQDFYYETQYSEANEKNSVGFDKKILVFEDIDCVGDIVLARKSKNEAAVEDSLSLDEDDDDFDVPPATKEEAVLKREIAKAAKRISNKMSSQCVNTMNSTQDHLTMDDLLNSWDGIRENTGRIMIITSNYYEKLDPALVRPGRIDITLKLDNVSREIISEMYRHYYKVEIDKSDLEIIPDRFYSPAEIINFYLSFPENPRGFIERLACSKKIT